MNTMGSWVLISQVNNIHIYSYKTTRAVPKGVYFGGGGGESG